MAPPDSTISRRSERWSAGRNGAALSFVLQSDRPLSAPRQWSLHRLTQAVLGRGPEHRAAISEETTGRRLAVEIPDAWMSSFHARLSLTLGSWVIEDARSKNGTLVNGKPINRASLAEGDLIELGQSFFLFRASVPIPERDSADSRIGSPAADGRLATLVPSLAAQFSRLKKIARSEVPVMLGGETGSGKEVIASVVHALSRRPGPLLAVNCAALPPTLVESELFGYRKGAFSGADDDRPGLIRSADRGTLFLDEIGDMPLGAQGTLLRVLEQREVLALGATIPTKVDIRVISATHRPLAALARQDLFRNDLLNRLSGFELVLPPLRQRLEDLGSLAAVLLRRLVQEEKARRISFSCPAARALFLHRWPGNVRELEKCLAMAVALADDGPIELHHLPDAVQAALEHRPAEQKPAQDLTGPHEKRRAELVAALDRHGGNIAAVARDLGKARFQIMRWLKRYAIEVDRFRR